MPKKARGRSIRDCNEMNIKICVSYVLWYNRKYERIGCLFQDRYKSEPIEENEYLLNLISYIFEIR